MVSLYLGVWCFTLILWALRSHVVLAGALSRERRDGWTGLLLSSRADEERPIDGGHPAGSGGGPPREPIRGWLAKPESMRLVRRWLELLGIPRPDRRDLAHDVAAAALRSAPRYRPERATPERWINAITVHTVSKWLDRARHRREVLSAAPPERATAAPPPDVMIAAEEERAGLMAALEEVAPAAAAVLVAHDLDGERAVEIAARGGLPPGTVYTRHRRGMRVLAKVLLRRFRSLGNVAAPVLGRAALSAAGPRRREA